MGITMWFSGRFPCLAALTVTAALTVPGSARSQIIRVPDVQQEPDTLVAETELAPISAAGIPLRARQTLARLRYFGAQLDADPDIAAIEAQLPDELQDLSRAHERVSGIILEHLSLRELQDLRQVWLRFQERLEGWRESFEDESEELKVEYQAILDIGRTWELTREALEADPERSEALLSRVETVLASVDTVDARIRAEEERYLELGSQLDVAASGVYQVVAEVTDALHSVRGRTMVRNSPPLWSLIAGSPDPRTPARLEGAWQKEREALRAFVDQNLDRMLFHLLLFLVFAALIVRLHRRIAAEPEKDDEVIRDAAETLSRPVSAALLIALLFTPWIYPRAPLTVWEAASLLAVLPVARLLPRSRSQAVNQAIWGLLILFAIAGITEVILPPSFFPRLLGLAIQVAIVGGAAWLLHTAEEQDLVQSAWGRTVRRALQLGLVLGAIALIANVLGWTFLSELLTMGILGSAYTGLVLVIAVRVLAGVIRITPMTRVGSASRALRLHGDLITSRLIRAIRVVAFATWVWYTLSWFELAEQAIQWIDPILNGSIEVGILNISLGKILSFALVLVLAIWAARFVSFVLSEEVLPRLELKRGVANAVSTVVRWTILGLGILLAAGAAGLGMNQLALVAGALGVGIGFGLQNIVNNFVSGLILIFEQPIKVGDKVEIFALSLTGEVRRIGIRASVVRSFDGAEVIVPNANLISSEVVNWTLSDQRRRIRVEVGVAYGTDPKRVIEILKKVASDHPEILRYPEPQVLFLGFGDSSLNFRLLAWTPNFDDFLRLRSELSVRTNDAIKEAGIEIPFPQRDLHVKSVTEGAELPPVSEAGDDGGTATRTGDSADRDGATPG